MKMLETKTRIQGRSVVVTLPVQEGIDIEPNRKYIVSYEENGSVVLVPKIENPFLNGKEGDLYEPDIWEDMLALGNEVLDD